jgi:ribosomal protein S18
MFNKKRKNKKSCRAILYENDIKIDRIDYNTIDELKEKINEKGY